jgi:hypothetical protein
MKNHSENLREHSSPRVTFDSEERVAPRCAEATRIDTVIQQMGQWINDGGSSASIFWLYGGTGVGMSALAQTLAEKYD